MKKPKSLKYPNLIIMLYSLVYQGNGMLLCPSQRIHPHGLTLIKSVRNYPDRQWATILFIYADFSHTSVFVI